MTAEPRSLRLRLVALLVLLLAAYAPIVDAGWVWDDDSYVTANPVLDPDRDIVESFRAIWIPGGTPQYYPLVFTSFWIEARLLGPDFASRPFLFHATNLLLHALSALLLWRILARLGVPGAWLAAAIVALHPMNVESVAWVTERKNTLSLALALGSVLAWIRYGAPQEEDPSPRAGWYAAALLLFVAAMLAKTTAAATAPALVLVDLLRRRPIDGRALAGYLPFFAIGVPLGLFTAHVERTLVGASAEEIGLAPIDRIVLAPRIALFYLATFLWPTGLAFIYPRWTVDAGSLAQWIPLAVALCAAAAALVAWRRGWRGPILLLLLLGACLFPALGFIDVYPFRYSFVADHFAYLATIPMAIASSLALVRVGRRLPALGAGVATALLLVLLAALTFAQATAYRDEETLWRRSLAANPEAWMPSNNLAGILLGRAGEAIVSGDAQRARSLAEEAEGWARRATELAPQQFTAWNNLAESLRLQERRDEALVAAAEASRLAPELADTHWQLGRLHEERGDLEAAIAAYRAAVEVSARRTTAPPGGERGPGELGRRFALARALQRAGRHAEAARAYESVLALRPNEPYASANLGFARLAMQERDAARLAFRAAIEHAPDGPAGEGLLVSVLPSYADLLLEPGASPERIADARTAARWLVERTAGAEPVSLALLAIAESMSGDAGAAKATMERALALPMTAEIRERVEKLKGRMER